MESLLFEISAELIDFLLFEVNCEMKCLEIKRCNSGMTNYTYVITTNLGDFILKIYSSDSSERVNNEVSIMKFLSKNSKIIKVPQIFYYNFSEDNVIKRRFILMEKLIGLSIEDIFKICSLEEGKKYVDQIFEILGEFSNFKFDKIGSFRDYDENLNTLTVACHADTSTGPFSSNKQFYRETFDYYLKSFDQDPIFAELKGNISEVINLEIDFLQKEDDGNYVLCHNDLNLENIFVDPINGEISGIIDWEFATSNRFIENEKSIDFIGLNPNYFNKEDMTKYLKTKTMEIFILNENYKNLILIERFLIFVKKYKLWFKYESQKYIDQEAQIMKKRIFEFCNNYIINSHNSIK